MTANAADDDRGTETYVSEAGVYQLALTSPSPVNTPFLLWVVREVLPSIRRTGSYTGGFHPEGAGSFYHQLADKYNEHERGRTIRKAEALLQPRPGGERR